MRGLLEACGLRATSMRWFNPGHEPDRPRREGPTCRTDGSVSSYGRPVDGLAGAGHAVCPLPLAVQLHRKPAETDVPMKTNLSISLLCGFFLILANTAEPTSADSEGTRTEPGAVADAYRGPVTVEAASGRRFTAEVDARTDRGRLWLRWGRGSDFILRPMDWERVVRVQVAGETFSGGEFHRAVGAVRDLVPASATAEGDRPVLVGGRWDPRAGSVPAASGYSAGQPAAAAPGAAGHGALPVRSLEIEARAANWDADVEADGLIIDVYPRDAAGAIVPVHGVLEVDLVGERTGVVRLGQPLRRVGRWTRQVRPTDFSSGGARYRLPFQSVHPEFDLEWAPYAAVHARLNVPGHGVLETTESAVRVRAYSPIRDRFQQATGQRFFRLERTGRGRR